MPTYRHRKGKRDSDLVSASEIAAFVYCAEAWRLEHGLGNRQALDLGDRHHARKAAAERIAGGSIGIGRMLIVVALAALLPLWLVWR
jgi:hypothetical protein